MSKSDLGTLIKVRIGAPRAEIRERTLQEENENISDYFSMEDRTAKYVYDFGDTWEHTITLEERSFPATVASIPSVQEELVRVLLKTAEERGDMRTSWRFSKVQATNDTKR